MSPTQVEGVFLPNFATCSLFFQRKDKEVLYGELFVAMFYCVSFHQIEFQLQTIQLCISVTISTMSHTFYALLIIKLIPLFNANIIFPLFYSLGTKILRSWYCQWTLILTMMMLAQNTYKITKKGVCICKRKQMSWWLSAFN